MVLCCPCSLELEFPELEGWYCGLYSWGPGVLCCAVLCYAVGIGFQQTWVETRVKYISSRWEGCLHV
jgi:hypothetical protein